MDSPQGKQILTRVKKEKFQIVSDLPLILGGIPPGEGALSRVGGGHKDPRFWGREIPQDDEQNSRHNLGTFWWELMSITCVHMLWSSHGPVESPSCRIK